MERRGGELSRATRTLCSAVLFSASLAEPAHAQDVETSTGEPAFVVVAAGETAWFPAERLLYVSKEKLAELGVPYDVSAAWRAFASLLPAAYSTRISCETGENDLLVVHHELTDLFATRWLSDEQSPLWQSLNHLTRLPPDFADSGYVRKKERVIGELLCAHYRIAIGEQPPAPDALARRLERVLRRRRVPSALRLQRDAANPSHSALLLTASFISPAH